MDGQGKSDTRHEPVPTKYIYKDGTPFPEGYCVWPDNYTASFTVCIRSQFPVSEETIKELIKQKIEVLNVIKTSETCVVRNPEKKDGTPMKKVPEPNN